MDRLFAGIDLHSNNLVIGVINERGERLKHRKLDCDLHQVVQFLEPLKPERTTLFSVDRSPNG